MLLAALVHTPLGTRGRQADSTKSIAQHRAQAGVATVIINVEMNGNEMASRGM